MRLRFVSGAAAAKTAFCQDTGARLKKNGEWHARFPGLRRRFHFYSPVNVFHGLRDIHNPIYRVRHALADNNFCLAQVERLTLRTLRLSYPDHALFIQ